MKRPFFLCTFSFSQGWVAGRSRYGSLEAADEAAAHMVYDGEPVVRVYERVYKGVSELRGYWLPWK